MGKKDSLIRLAFVCIFMGGYSALIEPLIRDRIASEGSLYTWGVASALLFISGTLGLVFGMVLTRKKKVAEVV